MMKIGLVDSLTRSVLRAALAQYCRWREAGLALELAVNVSMDTLTALDFPEDVCRETEIAGVPPTGLVRDIRHSRLNSHPLATLDILTRLRLRLRRIVLSINDFGIGLRRWPSCATFRCRR